MTSKPLPSYLINGFLLAALAVLIFFQLLMAATPPVSIDALTHHLAIPKLYLQQGRIHEISHLPFGYYPMNVDLLYLGCLYLGSDIAPKILHLLFGLGTAAVIYDYMRRKFNTAYGLLGAVLFLSLPIVVRLSGTAYVDLGFLFFCTLSLRSLMSWIWARASRKAPLVWSGVWCGLALGTKYNGLVFLFVVALMIPLIYLRLHPATKLRQVKAISAAALWVGMALLLFSPWMIRNLAWTGNPLYPLYQKHFKTLGFNKSTPQNPVSAQSDPLDVKLSAKVTGNFATRYVGYNESIWEISTIPIRIFFQGRDHNAQYFDGRLNPYLLLLPLLMLLRTKPSKNGTTSIENSVWLWTAVLIILFTFFKTDMRIRYILPAIPPLIILGITGVEKSVAFARQRCSPGQGKALLGAALAAGVLLMWPNVAYVAQRYATINPLAYLTDAESRSAFIERFRREHAVYQYMNRHLPQDSLVLGIYLGRRSYYADRPMRFSINYFWRLTQSAESGAQIAEKLSGAGITHLIVRYDLFENMARLNYYQEIPKINDLFNKRLRKLFAKNGYGLYQLIDTN